MWKHTSLSYVHERYVVQGQSLNKSKTTNTNTLWTNLLSPERLLMALTVFYGLSMNTTTTRLEQRQFHLHQLHPPTPVRSKGLSLRRRLIPRATVVRWDTKNLFWPPSSSLRLSVLGSQTYIVPCQSSVRLMSYVFFFSQLFCVWTTYRVE